MFHAVTDSNFSGSVGFTRLDYTEYNSLEKYDVITGSKQTENNIGITQDTIEI